MFSVSDLFEFPIWKVLQLKPSSKLDPEFYSKFTEKVIGIYNLERPPLAGFHIFPKKVTNFLPKVVVFFKNVIENGDRVSVELRRGGKKELISQVRLVNPYSGIIEIPRESDSRLPIYPIFQSTFLIFSFLISWLQILIDWNDSDRQRSEIGIQKSEIWSQFAFVGVQSKNSRRTERELGITATHITRVTNKFLNGHIFRILPFATS